MTNFLTFLHIQSASTINKVIYYLRKIPIAGELISHQFYGTAVRQVSFSILSLLLRLLIEWLKAVGTYLVISIIFLFVSFSNLFSIDPPVLIESFVLFSILYFGSLTKGELVEIQNLDEVYYLKTFDYEPKVLYSNKLLMRLLFFILSNSLALYLVKQIFFAGNSSIWGLVLLAISLRVLIAPLMFFAYKYTWLKPNILTGYRLALSLLLYSLPVLVFIYGVYAWEWTVELSFFNQWPIFLLSLAILMLGSYLWIYRAPVNQMASQHLSLNQMLSAHIVFSEIDNPALQEVSVKDSDLSLTKGQSFDQLEGVAYLNAVFYNRVRKNFHKKVRNRTIILSLIYVGILIATYMLLPANFQLPIDIFDEVTHSIVALVILAVFSFSIGEPFTKFHFYNLDKDLMRYRFFQEPRVILSLFYHRFIKLIKLHLPMLIINIIGFALLVYQLKFYSLLHIFVVMMTMIVTTIFFAVHYLVMYFLFQPFTVDMKVKSPVYSITNGIIVFIVYYIIQTDYGSMTWFIGAFLLTMLIYIPVAIFSVYRFAPKRFRLNKVD